MQGMGINRYIMECKFFSSNSDFFSGLFELIDTLWNVNLNRLIIIDVLKRINRYIMECKCWKKEKYTPKQDRINRYIMECK